MKHEFTAIIEPDGDWYIAYCPEIPGANGQGGTKQEARQNLAEAIELALRVLRYPLGLQRDPRDPRAGPGRDEGRGQARGVRRVRAALPRTVPARVRGGGRGAPGDGNPLDAHGAYAGRAGGVVGAGLGNAAARGGTKVAAQEHEERQAV